MREVVFQIGEYYHIYNRGVDGRDIFCNAKDYLRFLRGMREFNRIEPIGSLYQLTKIPRKPPEAFNKLVQRGSTPFKGVEPLIKIVCYCLNANHYHLLIKQKTEDGISEFMKRVNGGYTCYFNYKYS